MLRFIGGRGSSLHKGRPLKEGSRVYASRSRIRAGRVCESEPKALNYYKDYNDYEKELGVLSSFSRGLLLKPFLFLFYSVHCSFFIYFFFIITIMFPCVSVRVCCYGHYDWRIVLPPTRTTILRVTVKPVALRKLVSPLSCFTVLLKCFSDFTIFTPEEYDNMQNKSVSGVTQPAASAFPWSPEQTLSLPGIIQLISLVLSVISVLIFYLFIYMLD